MSDVREMTIADLRAERDKARDERDAARQCFADMAAEHDERCAEVERLLSVEIAQELVIEELRAEVEKLRQQREVMSKKIGNLLALLNQCECGHEPMASKRDALLKEIDGSENE